VRARRSPRARTPPSPLPGLAKCPRTNDRGGPQERRAIRTAPRTRAETRRARVARRRAWAGAAQRPEPRTRWRNSSSTSLSEILRHGDNRVRERRIPVTNGDPLLGRRRMLARVPIAGCTGNDRGNDVHCVPTAAALLATLLLTACDSPAT